MTIGEASRRTGWSPRMLRYLEQEGLVVPDRTESGYRRYGVLELNGAPDDDTFEFRRVAYDLDLTQRLMRQAGLPMRLVERLSYGR